MPARRKSRQRALQVLFLCDSRNLPVEQSIEQYYSSLYSAEVESESGLEPADPMDPDLFMETLARGTMAARDVLDGLIAERASNWRLERMPIVDRNLLRMAVFEMKDLGTPPAVVIDEALEIARRYSEEEAVPFINGVLDAVRKHLMQPTSSNRQV
jgi:N utilization substance protein B